MSNDKILRRSQQANGQPVIIARPGDSPDSETSDSSHTETSKDVSACSGMQRDTPCPHCRRHWMDLVGGFGRGFGITSVISAPTEDDVVVVAAHIHNGRLQLECLRDQQQYRKFELLPFEEDLQNEIIEPCLTPSCERAFMLITEKKADQDSSKTRHIPGAYHEEITEIFVLSEHKCCGTCETGFFMLREAIETARSRSQPQRSEISSSSAVTSARAKDSRSWQTLYSVSLCALTRFSKPLKLPKFLASHARRTEWEKLQEKNEHLQQEFQEWQENSQKSEEQLQLVQKKCQKELEVTQKKAQQELAAEQSKSRQKLQDLQSDHQQELEQAQNKSKQELNRIKDKSQHDLVQEQGRSWRKLRDEQDKLQKELTKVHDTYKRELEAMENMTQQKLQDAQKLSRQKLDEANETAQRNLETTVNAADLLRRERDEWRAKAIQFDVNLIELREVIARCQR